MSLSSQASLRTVLPLATVTCTSMLAMDFYLPAVPSLEGWFGIDVTVAQATIAESATSSYREKLVDDVDLDAVQVRRRCCYSKCTALTVGSVTSRPPLSLPTPEQCIPPPPAGTSAPAPKNGDCPSGVKLDGAMRAYVHANDGLCCYDIRD